MNRRPDDASVASRTGDRRSTGPLPITFLILAVSGLIMMFGKILLLPLIGYTLFSWLAILAKNLHNFLGPLFIVCTVLLFLNFVRDNVRRNATGSGSAISAACCLEAMTCHPASSTPARRPGSGAACSSRAGRQRERIDPRLPELQPDAQTMQIANIIHLVIASLFMLAALGHIYMGTLGMAGAYDAMSNGYVDERGRRSITCTGTTTSRPARFQRPRMTPRCRWSSRGRRRADKRFRRGSC